MRLPEEKMKEVDKLLDEKQTLKDNLKNNISEIKRLNFMKRRERNIDDLETLKAQIREGEYIVATQKNQLLNLSIQKIAEEVDAAYLDVRYYEGSAFRAKSVPVRDVRKSLGLAV